MHSYVIDTSVVLAHIKREPINPRAVELINEGTILISSVNYCEAIGVLIRLGRDGEDAIQSLDDLEFEIIDFNRHYAIRAAKLFPRTRLQGLSFGDRACLALAQEHSLPVLTAERIWSKLDLGIKIEIVR